MADARPVDDSDVEPQHPQQLEGEVREAGGDRDPAEQREAAVFHDRSLAGRGTADVRPADDPGPPDGGAGGGAGAERRAVPTGPAGARRAGAAKSRACPARHAW
ncbi:hypothetical protein IPZ61_11700 [Streptomyces sioyaensis]|uniref:hypothetical protein n=1 Tax=Streptomyces sioyaensis TaxID=67364 RepID=UPI001F3E6EF1|nr:hypothetical protein [Streptomyces sioyaensis]MCF3173976.1 hypothetical protein [Streptomyces sioyaensis]